MIRIFVHFLSFALLSSLIAERRIGKLYQQGWEAYFDLGANSSPYSPSELNPDFSTVGALLSRNGTVGTGTLIAPNVVVTAAHVIRNSFADEVIASDWQFLLGENEDWESSSRKIGVSQIVLHPGWIARQTRYNRFGDGDELGVDLALVYLTQSVVGVFPSRLPQIDDDPLGQRAVLAGYGTLVEGLNGTRDETNQRRVGGENIFDRSVPKVQKAQVPDEYLGGLLAIDFDSSSSTHNTLAKEKPIVDLLGEGDSEASPLPLEASTAYGDSGGPAFAKTQNAWRVHGVVSYGTKNSRYGDITVFTRLASHYDWIMENLPAWPSARLVGYEDWIESDWWGMFLPLDTHWNYHVSLGWNYIPSQSDDSFWSWESSMGWCWFSASLFPYYYEMDSSAWYYLHIDHSRPGKIVRYNYRKGGWEVLDD